MKKNITKIAAAAAAVIMASTCMTTGVFARSYTTRPTQSGSYYYSYYTGRWYDSWDEAYAASDYDLYFNYFL